MSVQPARIEQRGDGVALQGALGFATVPALWRELCDRGLLAVPCSVDLSGVTHADSAGLALLVAWRAAGRARGEGSVRFTAVPPRLQALAGLTQAQALLDIED